MDMACHRGNCFPPLRYRSSRNRRATNFRLSPRSPELVVTTRETYGNHTSYEWIRAWRFFPGSLWQSHEPPRLHAHTEDGGTIDLAQVRPFTHAETEAMGLVFQHFAYSTLAQAQFK